MAAKPKEAGREPFDPKVGKIAEPAVDSNGAPGRRERRRRKKEARRAKKEQDELEKEQAEPEQQEGEGLEPEQATEGKPQKTKVEAAKKKEKKPEAPETSYRRIGHKGADLIVEGNTLESFDAAAKAGAEMIEFDVLRTRDGQLIVAHDYADAARRRPMTLVAALDAFCEPPLDKVELDCDLKLPGREAELAGALAGRGLIDRAMISTMELSSLAKLRGIDPDLRLGWTFPKTRRDWTKERWARPAMGAGLYVMRRRFPQMIRDRAPQLGVEAVWAYHMLITAETVAAAEEAGVELYAWTVDDAARIAELSALGVHGIVSNDPRILT